MKIIQHIYDFYSTSYKTWKDALNNDRYVLVKGRRGKKKRYSSWQNKSHQICPFQLLFNKGSYTAEFMETEAVITVYHIQPGPPEWDTRLRR